jgi:hypothetical protein
MLNGEQHASGNGDRDECEQNARGYFSGDVDVSDDDIPRPLAVRAEKQKHQANEQHGVEKRHADNESDAQLTRRHVRPVPERAERHLQSRLCWIVGTDQNFEERNDAMGDG